MRAATVPIWHYFGRSGPTDDQIESLTRVLPAERMHGAWEDGRVVGGAGAFLFELTVPGGRVPAAGVTVVGVLPTHRRRGILTAMMRAQLDACHHRGEPVAYLWATEDVIYGRFGYGIASFTGEIELPRERAAYYAPLEPSGCTRIVPLREAEALVAPVYERVAAETPGMFARTSGWWQARVLADPDWRRRGGGELQCVVLEATGGPAAYALYRLNPAWDRGVQTGAIDVTEAMGDSPETTRAIWRYLLDLDWMARVKALLLPLDHPLLLLLAEPRRLRFSIRDGLWVRLVDVGGALSARSYAAQDAVVIEVVDPFCPWNDGRWWVGDRGVERTEAAPDLRCDVTALGSVYLGGFTWAQLARALRAEELRPGAAARADALFRTGCAPWCPEIF
jgi:predicted acetyltransferase